MTVVAQVLAVVTGNTPPGWQPGQGLTGIKDPSSTPDPSNIVGTLVPALKAALLGGAGAGIAVAAGIWALIKGVEVLMRMYKTRHEPQQLSLF